MTPAFLDIAATALGMGAVVVAAGRWMIRATLQEFSEPLRDTVTTLTVEMKALTVALEDQRRAAMSGDRELRVILEDLTRLVAAHDKQLAVHDARMTTLFAALVPQLRPPE